MKLLTSLLEQKSDFAPGGWDYAFRDYTLFDGHLYRWFILNSIFPLSPL